jgi:curved DNA-binding protein CbpA
MGNTTSKSNNEDIYKSYINNQFNMIHQQQQQITQLLNSMNNNNLNSQQLESLKKLNQEQKIKFINELRKLKEKANKPSDNTNSLRLENKIKLDPYKILGIGKNYDKTSLKKAYLKSAIKYHPDRPGGNQELFQQVSIAYTVLQKKLESNTYNDHNTLKTSYKSSITENKSTYDNKKFDIDVFNKIYDENKMETNYDTGYGDWMSNKSNDVQQQKMFQGKFNKDMFNHEFDKYKKTKKSNSNNIVVHNLQENISLSNSDSIVHLGQGRIGDFSGESGGLGFRDLKDAYENTTLISEDMVDLKKRDNNINSLKSNRSNINYNISEEDQRNLNLYNLKKSEDEKKRIERLEINDRLSLNNYQRVHNRLVNN